MAALRDAPAAPPFCELRNGFAAVPEVEAIECDERNIAPFSLPAEALTYAPSRELAVTTFRNGDRERKIHCNIELDTHEQELLLALQKDAAGSKFFPSVSAMATRFLSHCRNDRKKALRLMKATQAWRESYFRDGPIRDSDIAEDMAHGIVYFCGRDSSLRPALVVRGNRIPQQWYKEKRVDRLIRLLIFCMEYMLRYMLVPGRVENLSVIVDLNGLGLSQVPLSALGEVYKVMSQHYIGRVYRFYVCNIPSALNMISGMAKSLLTDRQKQKIVVLSDVKELLRDFAPQQLEVDLGGTRASFETFFPFELTEGPFGSGEAGQAGEPVPDVHRALSRAGTVGKLWDPCLSREENERLECSPCAVDLLARCGLPRPVIEDMVRPESRSMTELPTKPDDNELQHDAACSDGSQVEMLEKRWLRRAQTGSTEEGTARAADGYESSQAPEDDDGDWLAQVEPQVHLESASVGLQCGLGGLFGFGCRPCRSSL